MLRTIYYSIATALLAWCTSPLAHAADVTFMQRMGIPVNALPTEVTEEGYELTAEQCRQLLAAAGPLFQAEQSAVNMVCVRPAGPNHTLVVYDQFGDELYRMMLATYDSSGRLCDAMCSYDKWSDEWELNPGTGDGIMRAVSQELSLTSDDRLTVNCAFRQYMKGHYDAPSWIVRWHQSYKIDEKGRFVLTDVAEDERRVEDESEGTPPYDEVVLTHMRVFTLCLVSQHHDSALTAWETFLSQAEQAYGGRKAFENGGIAGVGLAHLYRLNPQRLLQWVGTHHGPNDRLAAYFARCEDFIEGHMVRGEVAKMKDAAARRYVSGIVSDWE